MYFEEFSDSAFVNGIVVDRILTDVNDNEVPKIQNNFNLNQNYPNPFNPTTTIKYSIADLGKNHLVPVKLRVFDVLGNKIEILVNDYKNSGNYSLTFDASNYPSGIYFYNLMANGINISTKKMVLI